MTTMRKLLLAGGVAITAIAVGVKWRGPVWSGPMGRGAPVSSAAAPAMSDIERSLTPVAPPAVDGVAGLRATALQPGSPAGPGSALVLRYALKPGDHLGYVYRFTADTTINMSSQVPADAIVNGDTSALKQTLRTIADGRLELFVRAEDARGVELLVRFPVTNLRFEAGERSFPVEIDHPVLASLRSGALVHMDRNGTLSNLRLPRMPDESIAFVRAVLAELQTIVETGDQWRAVEADVTGKYRADYRIERWFTDPRGASVAQIAKKKVDYQDIYSKVTQVGQRAEVGARVSGAARVFFDVTNGHLVQVTTDQAIAIDVATIETVVSRSSSRFELIVRDRAANLPVMAEAALVLPDWSAADPDDAPARDERSAAELLKLLTAQRADGAELSIETVDLLRTLTTVLRYPRGEELSDALRAMQTGAPGVTSLLAGALASAGTLEAQAALMKIAADPDLGFETRNAAVGALGQAADPSTGSEALVRGMVFAGSDRTGELWSTAILALGAMAAEHRATDPARAERIDSDLQNVGRRPLSKRDRDAWFSAIGNAGAVSSLSGLTGFLAADDEELRAGAVAATRRIQSPELDRRLQSFLGDASEQVRLAAVRALAERDARVSIDVLVHAASDDLSPVVRRESLGVLSQFVASDGRALAAVRAAQSDPDQNIRDQATTILSRSAR